VAVEPGKPTWGAYASSFGRAIKLVEVKIFGAGDGGDRVVDFKFIHPNQMSRRPTYKFFVHVPELIAQGDGYVGSVIRVCGSVSAISPGAVLGSIGTGGWATMELPPRLGLPQAGPRLTWLDLPRTEAEVLEIIGPLPAKERLCVLLGNTGLGPLVTRATAGWLADGLCAAASLAKAEAIKEPLEVPWSVVPADRHAPFLALLLPWEGSRVGGRCAVEISDHLRRDASRRWEEEAQRQGVLAVDGPSSPPSSSSSSTTTPPSYVNLPPWWSPGFTGALEACLACDRAVPLKAEIVAAGLSSPAATVLLAAVLKDRWAGSGRAPSSTSVQELLRSSHRRSSLLAAEAVRGPLNLLQVLRGVFEVVKVGASELADSFRMLVSGLAAQEVESSGDYGKAAQALGRDLTAGLPVVSLVLKPAWAQVAGLASSREKLLVLQRGLTQLDASGPPDTVAADRAWFVDATKEISSLFFRPGELDFFLPDGYRPSASEPRHKSAFPLLTLLSVSELLSMPLAQYLSDGFSHGALESVIENPPESPLAAPVMAACVLQARGLVMLYGGDLKVAAALTGLVDQEVPSLHRRYFSAIKFLLGYRDWRSLLQAQQPPGEAAVAIEVMDLYADLSSEAAMVLRAAGQRDPVGALARVCASEGRSVRISLLDFLPAALGAKAKEKSWSKAMRSFLGFPDATYIEALKALELTTKTATGFRKALEKRKAFLLESLKLLVTEGSNVNVAELREAINRQPAEIADLSKVAAFPECLSGSASDSRLALFTHSDPAVNSLVFRAAWAKRLRQLRSGLHPASPALPASLDGSSAGPNAPGPAVVLTLKDLDSELDAAAEACRALVIQAQREEGAGDTTSVAAGRGGAAPAPPLVPSNFLDTPIPSAEEAAAEVKCLMSLVPGIKDRAFFERLVCLLALDWRDACRHVSLLPVIARQLFDVELLDPTARGAQAESDQRACRWVAAFSQTDGPFETIPLYQQPVGPLPSAGEVLSWRGLVDEGLRILTPGGEVSAEARFKDVKAWGFIEQLHAQLGGLRRLWNIVKTHRDDVTRRIDARINQGLSEPRKVLDLFRINQLARKMLKAMEGGEVNTPSQALLVIAGLLHDLLSHPTDAQRSRDVLARVLEELFAAGSSSALDHFASNCAAIRQANLIFSFHGEGGSGPTLTLESQAPIVLVGRSGAGTLVERDISDLICELRAQLRRLEDTVIDTGHDQDDLRRHRKTVGDFELRCDLLRRIVREVTDAYHLGWSVPQTQHYRKSFPATAPTPAGNLYQQPVIRRPPTFDIDECFGRYTFSEARRRGSACIGIVRALYPWLLSVPFPILLDFIGGVESADSYLQLVLASAPRWPAALPALQLPSTADDVFDLDQVVVTRISARLSHSSSSSSSSARLLDARGLFLNAVVVVAPRGGEPLQADRWITALLARAAEHLGPVGFASVFPCDRGSSPRAVAALVDRISRAADMLEASFSFSGSSDFAQALSAAAYCLGSQAGVIITAPEELPRVALESLSLAARRYGEAFFNLRQLHHQRAPQHAPMGHIGSKEQEHHPPSVVFVVLAPVVPTALSGAALGRSCDSLGPLRANQLFPRAVAESASRGARRSAVTVASALLARAAAGRVGEGPSGPGLERRKLTVCEIEPEMRMKGHRFDDARATSVVYRILVSPLTTIDGFTADLWDALHVKSADTIVLDLHGAVHEVLSGPAGPAVLSLLVFGVTGQAQDRPVVVDAGTVLVIEVPAGACASLSFLSLVDWARSGPSRARPVPEDDRMRGLVAEACARLLALADRTEAVPPRDIREEEVLRALSSVPADHPLPPNVGRISGAIPFRHTPITCRAMAAILSRFGSSAPVGTGRNTWTVASIPVVLSGDTGVGKSYLIQKLCVMLGELTAEWRCLPLSYHVPISASFNSPASIVRIETDSVEFAGRCRREDSSQRTYHTLLVNLDELTSSPAQSEFDALLTLQMIRNGVVLPVSAPNPEYTTAAETKCLYMATGNPDVKRDGVFKTTPALEASFIKVTNPEPSSLEHSVRAVLTRDERGPKLSQGPHLETAVAAFLALAATAGASLEEDAGAGVGGAGAGAGLYGTVSLRSVVHFGALVRSLVTPGNGCTESLVEALRHEGALAAGEEDAAATLLSLYLNFGIRMVPRRLFYDTVLSATAAGRAAGAGPSGPVSSVFSEPERRLDDLKDKVLRAFGWNPENPENSVVGTKALLDNCLCITVAAISGLPVFLLGDDGMSKTLALSLVIPQMRGDFSDSRLAQKAVPSVQRISKQFSSHTAAADVDELQRSISEITASTESRLTPFLTIEELPMADPGPGGPQRAIHTVLDLHQTSLKDVVRQGSASSSSSRYGGGGNLFAFLATGNFARGRRDLPIGRALANRLLICVHEGALHHELESLGVSSGRLWARQKGILLPPDRAAIFDSVINRLAWFSTGSEVAVSVRSLVSFSRTLYTAPLDVDPSDAARRAAAANLQVIALPTTATAGDCQLAASFTQPPVADTVLVEVEGGSFFREVAAGMLLCIEGGGYYLVASVPGPTTIALRNVGSAGNVPPGSEVAAGSDVGAGDLPPQEAFWHHLVGMGVIDSVSVYPPPSSPFLDTLMSPSRPARPLLVLYEAAEDVSAWFSMLSAFYRHRWGSDPIHLIIPTPDLGGSTAASPTALSASARSGTDAPEDRDALFLFGSVVEQGGLVVLLNPESILDGIHTLLNDASDASVSTLEIRGAYEGVRINPRTRIVLFCERSGARLLPRSVVSRLAVVNSGVPSPFSVNPALIKRWPSSLPPLARYRAHLDRVANDGGAAAAGNDDNDEVLRSLLRDSEVTHATLLQSVIASLEPISVVSVQKKSAVEDVRASERPPDWRLFEVLAASHSSLRSLVLDVGATLDKALADPGGNTILLVDITSLGANTSLAVAFLAHIGFVTVSATAELTGGNIVRDSLLKFLARDAARVAGRDPAADDFEEALFGDENHKSMLLEAQRNAQAHVHRRLVVLVSPECFHACSPGRYNQLVFAAKAPGDGAFDRNVRLVEIRDPVTLWPDWPQLAAAADDPSCIIPAIERLAHAIVTGRCASRLPDASTRRIVEIVSESARSMVKVLHSDPSARARYWSTLIDESESCGRSLRCVLIEQCRAAVRLAAEGILSGLGGVEAVEGGAGSVAEALLASGCLPFQVASREALERSTGTAMALANKFMTDSMWRIDEMAAVGRASGPPFPFLDAMLEVLDRRRSLGPITDYAAALDLQFPQLRAVALLPDDLARRLAARLIDRVRVGGAPLAEAGGPSVGEAALLVAGNKIDAILSRFYGGREAWLSVGALLPVNPNLKPHCRCVSCFTTSAVVSEVAAQSSGESGSVGPLLTACSIIASLPAPPCAATRHEDLRTIQSFYWVWESLLGGDSSRSGTALAETRIVLGEASTLEQIASALEPHLAAQAPQQQQEQELPPPPPPPPSPPPPLLPVARRAEVVLAALERVAARHRGTNTPDVPRLTVVAACACVLIERCGDWEIAGRLLGNFAVRSAAPLMFLWRVMRLDGAEVLHTSDAGKRGLAKAVQATVPEAVSVGQALAFAPLGYDETIIGARGAWAALHLAIASTAIPAAVDLLPAPAPGWPPLPLEGAIDLAPLGSFFVTAERLGTGEPGSCGAC
jgi:hypothetical protein